MDAAFRPGAPCWNEVSAFAHDVWTCDIDPRVPPSRMASTANWIFSSWAGIRSAAAASGADVLRSPSASDDAVMARQCLLLKVLRAALRQPLPLDTTSGRTELMPQLLESQGTDLERFAATLSAASGTQESNVVIGSAASGVGKTHLAYAWGVRHGFSILSRAITSDIFATVAPPFAWLLAQLERLKVVPQDYAAAVSTAAFLVVRLTLLSYVHFSVLALRAMRLSRPSATAGMMHQLLLRLHRNGNADALVTTILGSLLLQMRVKKWGFLSTGDMYVLDEDKMRAYEVSLSAAARDVMGTNILFTVDEAHELMERLECRNVASLFHSQRADDTAAMAAAAETVAFQTVSENRAATCSLFYAVVLQLSSLQATHHWCAYVTGTALSMRRVADSTSATVATRCHPEEFAPEYRLTLSGMTSVLTSYWSLDDVLSEGTVCQHLSRFSGRPQLFVQGVFKPLLTWIRLSSRLPSATEFAVILDDSYSQCVRGRKEYVISKLVSNYPVAIDGSGIQALIPMLFKAAVMDNGMITLGDADQLAAAICTGLLAVSSTHILGPVNMREEPIIFEGIRAAVLDPAQEGRVLDVLIRSSQKTALAAKGSALELAISWHVALLCNKLKDPSLATLFTTLGVDGAVIPPDLRSWVVRATRVQDDELGVKHGGVLEATPLQRYFFRADGTIDDSNVFFNIPVDMGGDAAFLVSRAARVVALPVPAATAPAAAAAAAPVAAGSDIFDGRQYKLVVLQCRNVSKATTAETLLTLHPGTQFLQNLARKRLLNLPSKSFTHAVQDGWNMWHALALNEEKGFLTRNWVRVPVVARALDAKIAAFSLAAAVSNESEKIVRSWSSSQRKLAAMSPIVWVSLASQLAPVVGVFPESVRKAIIAQILVEKDTSADYASATFAPQAATVSVPVPVSTVPLPHTHAGISRMTMLHHNLWIPASVTDAAQLVAQSEEFDASPQQLAGVKRRGGSDDSPAAPDHSVDSDSLAALDPSSAKKRK